MISTTSTEANGSGPAALACGMGIEDFTATYTGEFQVIDFSAYTVAAEMFCAAVGRTPTTFVELARFMAVGLDVSL